jgi:acetoacetate decarboxylase
VDPDVVLHADDFDHLVLAIPVGAHPVICRSLMQASPRFAQMVQQVQTVQTFGVQLWLDREVQALGWVTPSIAGQPQRAVCDAYADPLNSFADNTHLIPLEDWGDTAPPRTLLYFCGPLPDEGPPLWFAPAEDTGFPARQHQRVKDLTLDWLARHTRGILPGACPPASPALDWALLHDDQGRSGPARLDAQYWCANVDPSERYVLSVAGSTRWRLRAGDSQFANLVLAGDWVDNGFAVGCVESATLGGLQAAQAITGVGAGAPLPAAGLGRLAQLGTTGATGATAPAPSAPPPTRTLPRFVPMLADLELPPPYAFRNLTIRSFPLRADPVRLQQAVDRLNIAPPEVCEVRAISNLVFMQLAQYPYLQSQPDPEGWFTENELGFAIPVAIGRRINGLFVPERVAYHFAMFFVDNDFAIATGREVFGYPKIASEMRFGAPGDPLLLTVDTLALQRRASTEPARKLRLVEVSETRHRSGLAALLAEIKGLAADLGDLVLGPAGLLDQGSPALWKAVLQTFGKSEIGIVSLKQFRDAADPSRACYQALVLSSFQIHTWHQRGLLAGDYSARIADDASMPIVDAFGLQRGADGLVPTMQPFAMRFDCTLGVGTNLWVAP